MNERGRQYKQKIKENAENRNAKQHSIELGDSVLLDQSKTNKLSTTYEPAFYVVFKVTGSTISARRVTDGREVTRDASEYMKVNDMLNHFQSSTYEDTEEEYGPPARQAREGNNWREMLLR